MVLARGEATARFMSPPGGGGEDRTWSQDAEMTAKKSRRGPCAPQMMGRTTRCGPSTWRWWRRRHSEVPVPHKWRGAGQDVVPARGDDGKEVPARSLSPQVVAVRPQRGPCPPRWWGGGLEEVHRCSGRGPAVVRSPRRAPRHPQPVTRRPRRGPHARPGAGCTPGAPFGGSATPTHTPAAKRCPPGAPSPLGGPRTPAPVPKQKAEPLHLETMTKKGTPPQNPPPSPRGGR